MSKIVEDQRNLQVFQYHLEIVRFQLDYGDYADLQKKGVVERFIKIIAECEPQAIS